MAREKLTTSDQGKSLDAISNSISVRAVAISAGDLSVVVRNEVKKTLTANRNDVVRSLESGLQELTKRNLISPGERDQLNAVSKHLLNAIRGKEDGEDAFLAIRGAYQELLKDQDSSPTALAIASVANSAFDVQKSSPLTITPMTTGAGAVIGAILGGVVGGIVGGGLGAGIGAAIGGAAGAAIGFCNEHGV
ncbi:hypothetical protein I6F26_32845 [Ensifer sp. IC3342]|nr:hypothetical protein [Ensifer sp. BRP08]MCA1451223.1 hypothetical protein [Ensifer sp. IC3342]